MFTFETRKSDSQTHLDKLVPENTSFLLLVVLDVICNGLCNAASPTLKDLLSC